MVINIVCLLFYHEGMNERIGQVVEYIKQHLHESLTVQQLAQMACLSEAQFYATFKKQAGQTPVQMITQLRMQLAYQQLLAGPVRIQALSEQCGYQNYESFSRVFKATYGLAPDDLARVVEHIKSTQGEVEELLVMKVDADDEHALRAAVLDGLKAQQVPEDLWSLSTAFQISHKGAFDSGDDTLIKKKYLITEASHLLTEPEEHS